MNSQDTMDNPYPRQPMAASPTNTIVGSQGLVSSHSPVMARSNPYNDLRPFIEYLWATRADMCKNIFIEDFPRGTDGAPATKNEEDTFLRAHFDEMTLQIQGGRFLKQVLYAIAKYNQDLVTEFAYNWAKKHEDYYSDSSMLMDMCSPNKKPRNFFEFEESAGHQDKFLRCAIIAIRQGILSRQEQELRDATRNTDAADGSELKGSVESSPETVKLTPKSDDNDQDSDVTDRELSPPVPQRASSGKMYAVVPRVFSGELTQAPPLSAPLLSSEWAVSNYAPQTKPDSKSRPQPAPQAGRRDLSSGQLSHVGSAQHGTPKAPHAVMIPPGPQTRAMQNNPEMAVPWFSNQSAYGAFGVQEQGPSYHGMSQAWTDTAGNTASSPAAPDYYYGPDSSRHVGRGRGDDRGGHRGGYKDRPHRPAHNSANMDPDSFTRLANDRPVRGHNGNRARRASGVHPNGPRHVSMMSPENQFQNLREPTGRRFFSDQHQTQQPLRYPSSSMGSEVDVRVATSVPLPFGGDPYGQYYQGAARSPYTTGAHPGPFYRAASESFIPADRNDIDRLLVFNVPRHIRTHHVADHMSQYANVKKVTVQHNSQGEYLVWFASAEDARRVLERNPFIIKDFQFSLHVPGMFLYQNVPTSARPANWEHNTMRGGQANGNQAFPGALNGTHDMASAPGMVQYGSYTNGPVEPPRFAGSGKSHAYTPHHGYEGDSNHAFNSSMPAPNNGNAVSKKHDKKKKNNIRKLDEAVRPHRRGESVSSNMTAITVIRDNAHMAPGTSTARGSSERSKKSEQDSHMVSLKISDRAKMPKSYAAVTQVAREPLVSNESASGTSSIASTPAPTSPSSMTSSLLALGNEAKALDKDDRHTAHGSDNSDNSILFGSDPARDSLPGSSHGGTPPRSEPITSSGAPVTSPKASDDIEDSFQTAAETPESAKSVQKLGSAVGLGQASPSLSAQLPHEQPNPIALTQAADEVSEAPATEVQDATIANKEGPQPVENTTSAKMPDETAPANNTITSEASATAKKLNDIKAGPRQTESLSPFATLKKENKKKAKTSRKARKSGAADASAKTHNRVVSVASSNAMSAESGSVVHPDVPSRLVATKEAAVLPPSPEEIAPDAATQEKTAVLPQSSEDMAKTVAESPDEGPPIPVVTKKGIFNRLLGGYMGSRDEKRQSVVEPEIESSTAEKSSDNGTKSEKESVATTQIPAEHVTDTGPREPTAEEDSHRSGLGITLDPTLMRHLNRDQNAKISSEIFDLVPLTGSGDLSPPHLQAQQEPALMTAKQPRKPTKKKKKSGKKNANSSSADSERSGRSSLVQDSDASSTATLQTHTPAESRSGSAEPNGHQLIRAPIGSESSTDRVGISQKNLASELQPYLRGVQVYQVSELNRWGYVMSQSRPQSRFSDVTDREPTEEETIEPSQPPSEDLLNSMFKMKELAHKEKIARYTGAQQVDLLQEESARWADEEAQHAAALLECRER